MTKRINSFSKGIGDWIKIGIQLELDIKESKRASETATLDLSLLIYIFTLLYSSLLFTWLPKSFHYLFI